MAEWGPLAGQLIGLGVSQPGDFEPFHPRVRDRADVKAYRCRRTGAIVLDRVDHIDTAHYEAHTDLSYWGTDSRKMQVAALEADDRRRADWISPHICGKNWLDVGTGLGGILDIAGPKARSVAAVEPQEGPRTLLDSLGYRTFRSLADVPDGSCDVATLFHVLEHIPDPVAFLHCLRTKLTPDGMILVEVPHARDILLTTYGSTEFREFTLWSEHLILHTRPTLEAVLRSAGFGVAAIEGCQRYPLANHLHWLANARPRGHVVWDFLRSDELDAAYAGKLAKLDATDTLLAWASARGVPGDEPA